MKKALLLGMALMATVLNTQTIFAADEKAAVAAPADATVQKPAMDEAKMAEMKKLGAPGENHKALEAFVGKWKATVSFWMSADGQPEVSDGSSESHWILGGRFVQQDFKGTSMGQPFEGLGIIGYDNIRGEYTSLWLDNMATGVMVGSAQFDAATKTMNGNATMSCPLTGEKNRAMRSVCKVVDADHATHEMYMNDKDGKEFRAMLISYERVQA